MKLEQQVCDTTLERHSRRSANKKMENGFYSLGIAPSLLKEIDRFNFANPTPIQKEAIPAGIRGDDIIAIARTGSGKTIAYGVPMLQRLSKMKRGAGLVLVPTRELAIQVDEALRTLGRSIQTRSAVLIGGASISLQISALRRNPRIIIATPGRLMDHIERRTVNLSNTEVFVLDEADRMLDMGFIPDIKKIMKTIPDKRQTMLFSATMPKEIEVIARKLMEAPTRIEMDRSGTTPAEVSHEMFFIKNQDKRRLLAVQLKERSGPVLVFTRTKRMASKLTVQVKDMGFAAAEIHSDRSLMQRRRALDGFKRGKYRILIATDIAARGIDVSGIELVVNYDMPANSEDYVHRIGRTGRAGKTGHAISFANTDQKRSIRDIERFMKTKLAISTLPILPSEKRLLKEADLLNIQNESIEDEKPPKRNFSKDRSSKRKSFKNGPFKKFARKRVKSR
ncbi:MAG: DEAD/DEAH box helicase [candidate division Zixibacteria bacterium]